MTVSEFGEIMTRTMPAAELLRLVEAYDGILPVCLDQAKAGATLLAAMLDPEATLVATVEDIEVPHAAPYDMLRASFRIWLDDGSMSGGFPSDFGDRPGVAGTRDLIAQAAARRLATENGLLLHPAPPA